ncbi:MAG: 6,7-dimethyl-8-ribityllumazine synthase [Flavobacteriales bacterium]|nr:MAG: 6,7-dimethyl-8-ribityllumazine synthase [Flavobacteriales bacterium]
MAKTLNSPPSFTPHFSDSHYKIGIVTSVWNSQITDALKKGAINTLKQFKQIQSLEIKQCSVPGVFEIATCAQWFFENGCDAVINLGCVIQGETPHFDYICKSAADSISQLALKHSKPCIFGILTTKNFAQALERAGGSLGNKGSEAAEAALWMLLRKDELTKGTNS